MVKNDDLLRDVPLVEGFKVLGPCVLLDRLGEGGMGAVYLGWHLNLQIFVAVKCLKRISSDHQQVERFRGEAKVLAKISAPNLIRVFDVTESAGLHFIVMEYVEGETAAERVQRKGALPLRDGLTIAYKAAKGLAATHEAGVIHRDIKPDNILLSRKGHVRLADLGIAKADHELNPVHTQSNVLMGTPNYMAPEQWDGAKQVSPRADVYAMGLSTYHMLTGTVPFQAASLFSVGKRVQAGELTDLAIKRPDASDALVQLIRSTTAVDPAERPEDGTALAAALGAELEHLGGPARLIDPGIGATARKAVRPSGDVLNAITAAMERAPGTREAYPPTIDVGERAYPPTVAYGSSAAAAAATATAAAQAAKATTATHEKPRRRWLAPVLITAVLAVIAIPAALLLLPLLRGGGTAETGDLRASSEAPTTPGSIGGAGPNGGSGDAGAAGAGARAADRSDSGGTGSAGSADSPAPPDAPDTPAAALRAQIDAGAWDEALETLRRFAGERTLTQAQLVGFLDETIVGLGHDLRANPALWDAPLDERLVALAGIWPEHVTTFLAETIRDHDEPSLSRFLDVTRLLEPEVTAGRLSSRDVRKLADPLLEDAAPKPVEWTEQNKADLSWATTNGSHEGFAILAEGLAHLETVSDASIFVDLHAAARRAIELGCMDRTEAAALTEDLVRRFPAERIEASWTDELEAALAWLHAELPSPPAGTLLARGRCRGKTHDGCASVLETIDLVLDLRQQGALGDAAARDDLNAVLGRSASLVTDDAACRELYPVLHQVARAPLRSAGAAAIVLEREARRFGEAGTCSATDFAGWVELWTLAKAESATRIDRLRSLADETCRGPLRQSLGAVFGNELPLPGGGAAGEVGAAGAHGANAASATIVTLPEATRAALRELKDYSPEARLLLAESLISYEWLDSGYSYPIVDAFVPKDPIEIRELLDGAEHPRARLYAGDLFIQPEVFGDLDREEARARGYDQLEQAARDGLADAHARLGLLMVIPDSKYRPDIVGGKARTDAGLEFLERAARGGSVRGKGWFGMFSLWIVPADMRAHDHEVYRTYLRDAAASGFQPAANFLDEGPPAAPAAP